MRGLSLWIHLLALSASGSTVWAADVVDIGTHRELFVDHYLIDKLEQVHLKLHEPQPAEIALTFDRPWEGGTSSYYTVLKDGPVYRMYYRGSSGQPGSDQVTCYAESSDGIRWTRPNLRLFAVHGTCENNVILTPKSAGAGTHNFCPFVDGRSGVPSSEKYKAVGGDREGLVPYVSSDGIRWRRLRERPVITRGAFDSQNVAFWSESEEAYVCYFRVFRDGVRSVSRSTSTDFVNWSDPTPMDFGDTPREHIYTNGTHPYFRASHIYVSLSRRFMPGRRVLSDEVVAKLDIEAAGNYPGLKLDCSDTVFMTSRGGNRYDRTFLEGFVRPGADQRNWVSRSNTPALGVVPTGPSQMSLYVGQHRGQPTHHLRRFTLRTDGFSSVHAPYRGGELVTKPLTFAGSKLVLNYSTSAAGSLRVEIQNEAGQVMPRYAMGEFDEIAGDEIERAVSWNGRDDLSALVGTVVRLRFVMKDSDVYSIRFR